VTLIVDAKRRLIAILAGNPAGGTPDGLKEWQKACEEAQKSLEEARIELGMSSKKSDHRRGEFSTIGTGFSYGGGQRKPMNFVNPGKKAEIVEGLNSKKCFERIARFGSCRWPI
jgi:hypothetical protein